MKYKRRYMKYKREHSAWGKTVEKTDTSDYDINFIFPDMKDINKKNLKISNWTQFVTSNKYFADKLKNIILKHTKTPNVTVTDMTANVGVEAIALAKVFKRVNAIELDDKTCDMLKHNVKVYGLKNVNVICGDSSKEINKLKQDVLYMDPLWGPDYKTNDKMDLFLGDNIIDIVNRHKHKVKFIVIRFPVNYNIQDFVKNVRPDNLTLYSIKKSNGKISYYVAVLQTFRE